MIIAIDPGDKHVGWAAIPVDKLGGWDWDDRHTTTFEPQETLDMLRKISENGIQVIVLVVEEFRLYPWKAKEQGFSQFHTAEMIGQLKLWVRWFSPETELVMQPAAVKKPTFAIMQGRKIPLTRGTQHSKDAEAHLYSYLARTRVVIPMERKPNAR